MNVSAIDHNKNFDISSHPSLNKKSKEISDEQIQLKAAEEEAAVQTTENQDETVESPTNGDAEIPGVLRLLQEGHFKGVADVRLRINFHDEIAALEQEKATQAAQVGISGLNEFVNTEIESLLQNESLGEDQSTAVSEAIGAFNTAISQIADDNPIPGTEGLISQVQTSFDEFTASLSSILTPEPEPETEIPPEQPIEPVDENANSEISIMTAKVNDTLFEEVPEFDPEQFIASLIESFAIKVQELETALSSISVLPELSQPEGNGKAYEKFLAIYNDLNGNGHGETLSPEIDTES